MVSVGSSFHCTRVSIGVPRLGFGMHEFAYPGFERGEDCTCPRPVFSSQAHSTGTTGRTACNGDGTICARARKFRLAFPYATEDYPPPAATRWCLPPDAPSDRRRFLN